MADSMLNLCKQVRTGLQAAKELAKSDEELSHFRHIMLTAGFDHEDIEKIIFTINHIGLEGQFDEDVGLD